MAKHDDEYGRAFSFAPQDQAAAERARKMRLLKRIADALHLPQATLHGPADPRVGSEADPTSEENDLDEACAALLLAYRRISDPEMRRHFLILAQETAERSDS
ncbi:MULTISPECIES: hypothetical protein [unclassified Methylobacterium]|uniref:hypothetical protein n=1 Tax=unclassified Methylobacterium TaxID=2615210 RepID=UPI0011C20643|nr:MULTISPECIES: hypothetical protein [unclassified Methylobacterium]QEE41322.1 hypothetical protein FVA80_22530 [Methylobacterium sp. WL1]TXN57752.1 hypothetical protein FV241_09845 [Methylobacterium sp. WL2]